ncbi:MAG TPA: carbohydrate porin [Stellaceae bacterium]|nr:carbohydrate porin [Stellaceae bacterium]
MRGAAGRVGRWLAAGSWLVGGLAAFAGGAGAASGPPGILFGEIPLPAVPPVLPGDLWSRANLLGDVFGLKPAIQRYGFQLNITETSELLDNPTGGIRRGAVYEGVTDLNLGWDLRTYFGWRGVFFARAYQIHGRGLSANDLDNLNVASGIEADRTTRLYELWYEQHIGDWLRIRVGQQSAGQEFIISTTAKLFVNSTFGWPTLPGTDLPSGGPNYPVGTPAVRFRIDASDELTFFAGLFNGNPTGAPVGSPDPQSHDLSGTAFHTDDGAFAIVETRYNPGNSVQNGTYRFGAWFNSERFPSPDLASNGLPLASPLSSGMPQLLDNDYSVYGIVDQPLYNADKDGHGLVAFARAMGAPGDRNLVDFYADAGLAYKGPFGRKDDQIGLAFGYARIGNPARLYDTEVAAEGVFHPIRSSESVVELTYQWSVAPWLQLQPDFQYIANPGGGIVNPNAPGERIGNAAIFGLRTLITF